MENSLVYKQEKVGRNMRELRNNEQHEVIKQDDF